MDSMYGKIDENCDKGANLIIDLWVFLLGSTI